MGLRFLNLIHLTINQYFTENLFFGSNNFDSKYQLNFALSSPWTQVQARFHCFFIQISQFKNYSHPAHFFHFSHNSYSSHNCNYFHFQDFNFDISVHCYFEIFHFKLNHCLYHELLDLYFKTTVCCEYF